MAGRGRPKAELSLSDVERETLVRWSQRRKSAQALALRCRIVLACADGLSNAEVADRLGVSRPTVGKWRSRFVERRLKGLVDEERPGAPRKITDEKGRGGGGGDPGTDPERRHPLVTGVDGQEDGAVQVERGTHLEGVSPQTTPDRDVQTEQGPAVHREGPRRGRSLPGPAGAGGGAVRGREVAGAGPRQVLPGAADDAGHAGETHPRLRPQR